MGSELSVSICHQEPNDDRTYTYNRQASELELTKRTSSPKHSDLYILAELRACAKFLHDRVSHLDGYCN